MASPTLQRRHVIYSGHVQGVGFRYTTRSIARGYTVTGFVRNLPDGRVELVADGAAGELDRLLRDIAAQMADQIRSVEMVASTTVKSSKGPSSKAVPSQMTDHSPSVPAPRRPSARGGSPWGEFTEFAIRY